MLRFDMGVIRLDRIRNKHIRGMTYVRRFGEKMKEARLRLYSHVLSGDKNYVGKRVVKMALPGKRKTKEKVPKCSERRYGYGKSNGGR